jgi:hypothetical protein
MSDSMSKADLIASLKLMLNDAAEKFTRPGDFESHLDIAAFDMGSYRPRTSHTKITLIAGQPNYPAPADMIQAKWSAWGTQEQAQRNPWDTDYPAPIPRLMQVDGGNNVKEVHLIPAPSAAQIADFGSAYGFYYYAGHVIADNEAETTIKAVDRPLLLIRAAAQAMQELAHRQVVKPVSLGSEGAASTPKNGTPAALAEQLMNQFWKMASA